LDGTLADIEHRRHFVRPPEGQKKDWKSFNLNIPNDKLNAPVAEILSTFKRSSMNKIVLCSGRSDNERKMTTEWLTKHAIEYDDLYMRHRQDHRPDNIVKEIILDFELLTRYTPIFMLDDRDQVVAMWRKRGFTCLQVAPGDF
jgi:hypothetical protein